MPIKLNLLPPEYSVSGGLNRFLKIVKMLGVIGLATFLVFVLTLAAFFIFSSFELKSLASKNDSLKAEIQTLNASEQKAVLLKDRLGKIRVVEGVADSIKNLMSIDPFISAVGEGITLSELSIDSQKVEISVVIKTVKDLTFFMGRLKNFEAFGSVVLTSFGFNPVSGYLVSAKLN